MNQDSRCLGRNLRGLLDLGRVNWLHRIVLHAVRARESNSCSAFTELVTDPIRISLLGAQSLPLTGHDYARSFVFYYWASICFFIPYIWGSNLGRHTYYADWGFCGFLSSPRAHSGLATQIKWPPQRRTSSIHHTIHCCTPLTLSVAK
jgi:hypothetical protein